MIGILWFLLAIVIIVTVHEYGHYIVGRWSGIKAEVFSIGFGPKLFSRVDRHGTRWQVAAIPLGGYVKFKGDADAASAPGDVSGLSDAERRQTMQGAPLWARSATVLAGPFANFLLFFVIFVSVIFAQGLATDEVRIGKTTELGAIFQAGDRIVSVDGQETPDFAAFYEVAGTLTGKAQVAYQVERAGQTLSLTGPNPLPPLVGEVMLKSAAMEAEMQPGDIILRAAGQDIASFDQLPDIVKASDGKPVELTIRRADQTFDLTMTPRRMDLPKAEGGFETRWLIGLSPGALFEPETRTPGLWEASTLAVTQGITVIRVNLEGMVAMVAGKISTCNLSSPVGMAGAVAAAAEVGFDRFIQTVAVFSLAIGLLNLFPIPVLDGGHLVFHVYEALTGKPPSDRVMQVLMTAGMALLLGVMLFALSNDLYRC
ncbi:RIP metalloprotease RseP [Rhodobacter sp. KR11]|uniref:RIP metalloprotease RseP n=1 Tax=Rhodobacter sp. KR11 TaxID=2974588 RepID=UPI002223C668|nr:RIP metalloprotease RseP [Rhodobacter sp. KR11]MCW1917720.1 RIP metalloprotease RseP [Rhodobacter sp. KR11]